MRPDADCGRERIHLPRHGFPWQSLNTTDLVDLTAALRSSVNTAFCAFCAAHSTHPPHPTHRPQFAPLFALSVRLHPRPIGETPGLPYFSYKHFRGGFRSHLHLAQPAVRPRHILVELARGSYPISCLEEAETRCLVGPHSQVVDQSDPCCVKHQTRSLSRLCAEITAVSLPLAGT